MQVRYFENIKIGRPLQAKICSYIDLVRFDHPLNEVYDVRKR